MYNIISVGVLLSSQKIILHRSHQNRGDNNISHTKVVLIKNERINDDIVVVMRECDGTREPADERERSAPRRRATD